MSHSYYQQGTARADGVRALFNRIAPRYDLINDLQSFGLHRYWKRRLLRLAEVQPGLAALDVCCGTGDLAEALASAGAKTTGCDFSSAMLAVAKARRKEIPYLQADALKLPFSEARFDIVTIGYGLRNLADFSRGLSELLRVLKPGGRLLILDFGKPRNPIWRAIYFAYLRIVVPIFGLIFCGDPAAYSYILESLRNYPAQDGVSTMLRELWCDSVGVYNFLGGIMSIHRAVKPANPPSLRQRHDVPLVTRHLVGQ
jgi:demethylmenaquinone methyltransferase / 2-methoxy-6-polyprenyl-1,4-benzoquinol methylase